MSKIKRALAVIATLLFLTNHFPLYSQNGEDYFYSSIFIENCQNHVNRLTSHSFLGRSTLTGHDKLASLYIDSLFKSFDLNSYRSIPVRSNFQEFKIVSRTPVSRIARLNGFSFHYGSDFLNLGINPESGKEFKIVFGGLGDLNEIDTLDLKGKALLVLTNNLRVGGMRISEIASDKGCALLILANPSSPKQFESISQQLKEQHNSTLFKIVDDKELTNTRFFSRLNNPVPQIIISNSFAQTLLGANPTVVYNNLQEGSQLKVIPTELKLKFDFQSSIDTISTHNVIGYIPSARGSQQTVIVSAHYDHLAPQGQNWYPGADDNASGIAVLVELARRFKSLAKEGYLPQRNILFAAFSAEEIGLLGSHYYTHNPLFPLDSTIVVLNMDMLGRMGNQPVKGKHLFVAGDNRLDQFTEILKGLNPKTGFKIDSKSLEEISLFSLSDHFHFMERGIPSFLITTGLHSDYHTTADTPEKLSYENMSKIADAMFKAINHFANKPDPWDLN